MEEKIFKGEKGVREKKAKPLGIESKTFSWKTLAFTATQFLFRLFLYENLISLFLQQLLFLILITPCYFDTPPKYSHLFFAKSTKSSQRI